MRVHHRQPNNRLKPSNRPKPNNRHRPNNRTKIRLKVRTKTKLVLSRLSNNSGSSCNNSNWAAEYRAEDQP